MAIRTKGDLREFFVVDEATYGVFNTSGSVKLGGVLSGWDDGMSVEMYEDEPTYDGQAFSDVVPCAKSYGFTADMTIPKNNHRIVPWLKRAFGITTSLSGPRTPTAFSAKFTKGPDEYLAYFGCRVDSFTMKAEGRGKPLQFSVTAFARYMAFGTSNTEFDNLGTSVVFGDATETNPPIIYCSPIKVDNVDIKAKSWSLTFNNHLQREEDGVIVNSVCYPLSAGLDSVATDREAIFEVTRAVDGPTWDINSYNAVTGKTITIVLDRGDTITLNGCYLEPKMCKASQGTYDETLVFHARSVSVTQSS